MDRGSCPASLRVGEVSDPVLLAARLADIAVFWTFAAYVCLLTLAALHNRAF